MTNSVKTMRTKDLVDVAEMARLTGLPAQTVRRYAVSFPRWIPTRTIGRKTMFSRESLPLLQRIRSLYEQGLTTDAVKGVLAAEAHSFFDIEVAVETPVAASTDIALPSGLDAVLKPFLAIWQKQTEALERQVASFEKLAASQAEMLDLLRHELAETKAMCRRLDAPLASPREKQDATAWPRERIIAHVLELRSRGKGKRAIATALENDGIPTLSGKGSWSTGTVGSILGGKVKGSIPTLEERYGI